MYNGWFQDSCTDIDIKRSSRTPLCHFDKLEGQLKQLGTARAAWGQRRSLALKRSSRTPLCYFDKLEGQREQPGDSRADIDIKRSSRTPLS